VTEDEFPGVHDNRHDVTGVRAGGRVDDVGGPGELAGFVGGEEVTVRRDLVNLQ
jgi:hypothetical protein